MTSRRGNGLLLLALVWVTVTGWAALSRGGLCPGLAHAQLLDESAAPNPAADDLGTRERAQNDRLTSYAGQVVYMLRVGRARLAVWERRLVTAQAELKEGEGKRQTPAQGQAELERLAAARAHEVAEAKARYDKFVREVETLKTFLAHSNEQKPLTIRQETLEVQVSVQWLKGKTPLRATPTPDSAVFTTISPEQPIIVLAAVRGTPWRLVSAAGQYGFLSSALLVAR